jgi:RNA polymerase sigma factor (sigma-70 family)
MLAYTQTHATLLTRLADSRDQSAWDEFCARYGDLIRGFCRHYGLQNADIDDVTQDVLLSLSKSLPNFTYDPTKGKFRSYLKTVVIHASQRRLLQRQPRSGLENVESTTRAEAADAQVDAKWESEWRHYHLRLAMRTIRAEFNEADLEAFERYAVAGEDAKRISDELTMTLDQVYQAKSRITRRLAALIAAQVADEG